MTWPQNSFFCLASINFMSFSPKKTASYLNSVMWLSLHDWALTSVCGWQGKWSLQTMTCEIVSKSMQWCLKESDAVMTEGTKSTGREFSKFLTFFDDIIPGTLKITHMIFDYILYILSILQTHLFSSFYLIFSVQDRLKLRSGALSTFTFRILDIYRHVNGDRT